jgi:hypothetical protein
MGFFKKSLTLEEKVKAVLERIETLKGWRAKSDGEIAEKKENVAQLLAKLALDENTEDRNSLRLAKTALGRMTDTRDEYTEQINFL